tara:strand:- start:5410 stop:5913 length:504 start_codon:yes stop_codon:yes gene_type:complete
VFWGRYGTKGDEVRFVPIPKLGPKTLSGPCAERASFNQQKKANHMTQIGSLTPSQDGPETILIGSVKTLSLHLDIVLRPTGEAANSNRPSHRIYAKSGGGQYAEIGSAWTKEMTSPDKFGQTFLSITLDDPSFAHPLNVSAFKQSNSADYAITWRRRQDRPVAAAAE